MLPKTQPPAHPPTRSLILPSTHARTSAHGRREASRARDDILATSSSISAAGIHRESRVRWEGEPLLPLHRFLPPSFPHLPSPALPLQEICILHAGIHVVYMQAFVQYKKRNHLQLHEIQSIICFILQRTEGMYPEGIEPATSDPPVFLQQQDITLYITSMVAILTTMQCSSIFICALFIDSSMPLSILTTSHQFTTSHRAGGSHWAGGSHRK